MYVYDREVNYLLSLVGGLLITLTTIGCLIVSFGQEDDNAVDAINLANSFPHCVM